MVLSLDPASREMLRWALLLLDRELRRDGSRLPQPLVDLSAVLDASRIDATSRQKTTTVDDITAVIHPPALMDAKDVGRELSVSERTVQRLAATGALPHVKVNGATRFRRTDVLRFVEEAS